MDRGKPGSKIHVLSDRAGLPLSLALSAANTNDAFALKPLIRAVAEWGAARGARTAPTWLATLALGERDVEASARWAPRMAGTGLSSLSSVMPRTRERCRKSRR